MIPPWAKELARLYWRLRMTRSMSRPCARTWRRRIHAEKLRQLEAGIPAIEIHLVCRLLVSPDNPVSQGRWLRYLERKRAGLLAWPVVPTKER